MSFNGNLTLRRRSALKSLPDCLTIPGALDLTGCRSLASIGVATKVGTAGQHVKRSQPSTSTPWARRGWRPRGFVPALSVADCPFLTTLPDDLQVIGPIDVADSGLRDLPASLAGARVLWRSVLVPPDVVFHPERLDPLEIIQEPNAELRRVMLERAGAQATLDRCNTRVIDADTDAGGPRKLVRVESLRHCYLLCLCPSTARQYLLRVPPDMRTCHQAAAWMAGFTDPAMYRPQIET
ncbi:MAG TPA: hypothetical protein VH370_05160 [Humisphaera sp.]|jgi:hypothetical protein|nr:hypothetical protein [Humisphaera sp.]